MGENLDVKYCIAARLIQNLSGAARRAALQLKDEQLQGTAEDRAAGIKAVLAHLNRVFSPDPLIRKAQTLSEFFSSRKYYRRQGQRMTDFVTTFDEGVTQMAADGINVSCRQTVAYCCCHVARELSVCAQYPSCVDRNGEDGSRCAYQSHGHKYLA